MDLVDVVDQRRAAQTICIALETFPWNCCCHAKERVPNKTAMIMRTHAHYNKLRVTLLAI